MRATALVWLVARAEVFGGATEAGAQFVQRERFAQGLEDLPAEVPDQPQFLELALEQALLVRRVGHLFGLQAVAGGRDDGDVALAVQEAGAKSDRGDVAFARGPQTQDESQRARRKVRLVRVRHDRGIEQRRRFEGILVAEIRAKQQLAFDGELLVGAQTGTGLFEPPAEELPGLRVALAELGLHLLPERVDFAFGQGHDLGANSGGAGVVGARNGRSSTRVRSGCRMTLVR